MDNHKSLDGFLRELVREVVCEVIASTGQAQPLRLYDVDQAAEMLSVPKRWIYERTSKNEIPFRKIGKFIRFSDADLQAIAGKGTL
jgi:excisionase family DNA binding protein